MNDELKNLFSVWQSRILHKENQSKGKPFVYDGVIDQEKWERINPKILFLAKEAYRGDDEKEPWSLCGLIREEWKGPRYSHWWNVSRWAYGIQRTTDDYIPEFPDDETAAGALFDIAFMNIKKSGGVSNSNNDDLKIYVESDGDLIERQVELVNPDIIIFCYTWHIVKDLWEHEVECVYKWVYRSSNRIFIDYYHPAVPWSSEIKYYALCAIYQKSLQKIGITHRS